MSSKRTHLIGLLISATLVLCMMAGCQANRRGSMEGAIDPIKTQGKVVALKDAKLEKGVWINHLRTGAVSPTDGDGIKARSVRDARRFALFIGIDRYPELDGHDLDGCVRDAWYLHAIFRNRLGFERTALLTNGQASRAGIHAAMMALLEAVTEQRQRDGVNNTKPITVVLGFAGHGRQVLDDDDNEEADGLDETWAASDSGMDSKQDIRDDELQRLYRRLAKLNCQVLIFSDSCHSGAVHRGTHKMRRIHMPKPVKGPSDTLFEELDRRARSERGSGKQDPESEVPLPGFVFYGACHEASQAFECIDSDGKPSGRFTFALRQVLLEMQPETTYESLYQALAVAFERLWPADRSQRPYFHADPAKRGEIFLAGGRPTPHAVVLQTDPTDPKAPNALSPAAPGRIRLSQGAIDGVAIGSRFVFYRNLADLAKREEPIVEAPVVAVQSFSSEVALPAGVKLPTYSKARLDRVKLNDFVVWLSPRVSPQVRQHLTQLHASQQLRLATKPTADVNAFVDRIAGGDKGGDSSASATSALGIYQPTQTDISTPTPAYVGRPAKQVRDRDPKALAIRLADHLLYLARVQRLMSLRYDGAGELTAQVTARKRDTKGDLQALARPTVQGVLRLKDRDLFTIDVPNKTAVPMYVTVFYFGANGELDIIYPVAESDVAVIQPGKTLTIGGDNPFTSQLDDVASWRRDGFERLRMKVVLSRDRVDLTPLTVPPRSDPALQRSVRSSLPPTAPGASLRGFFADVLLGGPATRSAGQAPPASAWAATTLIVDVEPRGIEAGHGDGTKGNSKVDR